MKTVRLDDEKHCRICGGTIKDPSVDWVEHYLRHRNEAQNKVMVSTDSSEPEK